MDRFFHFIVNKQSRNSHATLKNLLVELPKYTHNYKVSVTDSIEHLKETLCQLKENIKQQDVLVVVGGDGSLNQFITLYKKFAFSNYIAYIPAGSGNDFARTHGIPINTKKALAHLFSIQTAKQVSVIYARQGEIEHYALNSVGIGIDGLVNYMINSGSTKKLLGPASYISGVLSAFVKQQKFPLTLKVDEGVFHYENVQLALVANNPYFGGGIQIVPQADGQDELLDVVIADNATAADLLWIISRVFTNKKHLQHPKVSYFQTKEVALYTESEQYGQKDGEVFTQDGFAYSFTTQQLLMWI